MPLQPPPTLTLRPLSPSSSTTSKALLLRASSALSSMSSRTTPARDNDNDNDNNNNNNNRGGGGGGGGGCAATTAAARRQQQQQRRWRLAPGTTTTARTGSSNSKRLTNGQLIAALVALAWTCGMLAYNNEWDASTTTTTTKGVRKKRNSKAYRSTGSDVGSSSSPSSPPPPFVVFPAAQSTRSSSSRTTTTAAVAAAAGAVKFPAAATETFRRHAERPFYGDELAIFSNVVPVAAAAVGGGAADATSDNNKRNDDDDDDDDDDDRYEMLSRDIHPNGAEEEEKYEVLPREIQRNDDAVYVRERSGLMSRMDRAMQKDVSSREPDKYDHYDELDLDQKRCVRPKWSFEQRPSCNTFHEFVTMDRPPPTSDDHHKEDDEDDEHSNSRNYNLMEYSYLARGHFRSTWLLTMPRILEKRQRQQQPQAVHEEVVLKTNRYHEDRHFDMYTMSQNQVEAVTMLEMARNSNVNNNPSTTIFGHCQTSLLVEKGEPITNLVRPFVPIQKFNQMRQFAVRDMQREQNEGSSSPNNSSKVDDGGGVGESDTTVGATSNLSMNGLSTRDKLQLAIGMAEGLVAMHGNVRGAIANHDLSFDQYLLVPSEATSSNRGDGTTTATILQQKALKLNDFNKARILSWNSKNLEYCTFYSSQSSLYRAPEEVVGGETDESSDVNSFGKLLFSVLTGLRPYYEYESDNEARKKALLRGIGPYVDSRYRSSPSLIERRLVDIMSKCWQHLPKDRSSIFEVLAELRETARLVDLHGDDARYYNNS